MLKPFEPTKWNMLDDINASKIPDDDIRKSWIWLEKIMEHYIGACTLMQDRYYLWAKMSQPGQSSISYPETAV